MLPQIAVIGSGIAGLSAAHALKGHADVTLFEAHGRLGGHSHTVDVTLPGPQGLVTHGVDTGFLVFNEKTYPGLIGLFQSLDIPVAASDMSFSAQVPLANGRRLEWNGANLDSVFAQRSNLLRPRFWGMLRDILRFNDITTRMAQTQQDHEWLMPLSRFLQTHQFGPAFIDHYLLPMLGCIWSCPTEQMLEFPVATLIRFCHNHGLLQVNDRPQWFTVAGGSRQYVQAMARHIDHIHLNCPVQRIERDALGVTVTSCRGAERFDQVVLATHADQALRLLAQPSPQEQRVLGAFRFEHNRAVLHTDITQMPRSRKAWAAWNYERAGTERDASSVCLHYWINRLQPLPFVADVLVSLNPVRPVADNLILTEIDYEHPVFDVAAIQAQQELPSLRGAHRTHYAGAWMGYGFHEDGFQSGLQAAADVLSALARTEQAVA